MTDDEPQGDELPEDLDVTAYVGPYVFPDIKRRRIAGTIYFVLAAFVLWAALATDNRGLLFGAILLALIGAYHFIAGWSLKIDQTEALTVASRTVGFPVGHASAQLAWRGLRSRPAWRILVYSADEPPSMRGLVELDAVDGTVLGEYTETNPEDWTQYPRQLLAVKNFLGDFKRFILRGNVLDLAVAVIVGAAFNTVIQSLVNNIINPLIGFVFGKPNFKDLVLNLSCTTANGVKSCKGVVGYGAFLTDVVNFVIIGFSVFVIIKTFERLQNLRKGPPQEEGEPLTVDQELLSEIRDLLRDRAEPSESNESK